MDEVEQLKHKLITTFLADSKNAIIAYYGFLGYEADVNIEVTKCIKKNENE